MRKEYSARAPAATAVKKQAASIMAALWPYKTTLKRDFTPSQDKQNSYPDAFSCDRSMQNIDSKRVVQIMHVVRGRSDFFFFFTKLFFSPSTPKTLIFSLSSVDALDVLAGYLSLFV